MSTKLVPTFEVRGCRVVSATDPHGRILDFLERCIHKSVKKYSTLKCMTPTVTTLMTIFKIRSVQTSLNWNLSYSCLRLYSIHIIKWTNCNYNLYKIPHRVFTHFSNSTHELLTGVRNVPKERCTRDGARYTLP
jgi:hypothetical protein